MDIIEIKTRDAITNALPFFDRLRLNWNFKRITAMCGAAEEEFHSYDDIDDSDGDDECDDYLQAM